MSLRRRIPLALSLALTTALQAQPPPERPFIGPLPPEGPLVITVLEVSGSVTVRDDPDQPWRKAEVGMTLPEGAEARTGVRSFLKLQIGDTQIVTLDRLSTYKLLKANFQDGVYQTDAAVKYGRLRYEIETAGRVHDAVVRSATNTLAIRGTVFELYDQPPFVPQAVSYEGRVMVRNVRRQVAIGGKGGGRVVVEDDKDSAVATALAASSFDPTIDTARTAAEQRLIEQVIASGGLVRLDDPVGIPVVSGGTPIIYTDANADSLPGTGLNFVLNWSGNSDLNLAVALPKFGQYVAPVAPLHRIRTGGITAFDHRGGPAGGFEIVFFGADYPGSRATLPPGGFQTLPGPNVTDPVTGIVRPTVQILPLPGNELANAETYVAAIGFVGGESTPYSLQTWVKDPLSGQNVLVAGTFGTFTVDPQTGQLQVTKTDVFYRAPVGLPPTVNVSASGSQQSHGLSSPRDGRDFQLAASGKRASEERATRSRKRPAVGRPLKKAQVTPVAPGGPPGPGRAGVTLDADRGGGVGRAPGAEAGPTRADRLGTDGQPSVSPAEARRTDHHPPRKRPR
ncbi:MAG: FecR domain-containing protein [Phycisphaerae bacterium]|nr:FecR domain-containing protein [Phycisphaerae bacterium]